ncbi:MAG TPA: pteridine-dependent deoxygenase [Rhodanobacteraceae bacterium]|nr:pteridine-dependent deoxygenase [Rhodanobacteraceae bacterium]
MSLEGMETSAPARPGHDVQRVPGPPPFRVRYVDADWPGTDPAGNVLAEFDFGVDGPATGTPRHVQVPLPVLRGRATREVWTVSAPIATGQEDALRWSAGGGWRLVVLELDASQAGGIGAASEFAYRRLLAHVAASPERHVLRIWNYLAAINEGAGDAERYRQFCSGRARGMAAQPGFRYPAATAIGHQGRRQLLQVYALCARQPGRTLENPHQVSAWNYPRQYGPTAPSFARAMQMASGLLAISGTAAVIGHASRHRDDIGAQADAAFANLRALLGEAGLASFNAESPLKVYVRRPADADAVEAALARHLDGAVPRLLLQGDICRRELLVEIDGWCSPGACNGVTWGRASAASSC